MTALTLSAENIEGITGAFSGTVTVDTLSAIVEVNTAALFSTGIVDGTDVSATLSLTSPTVTITGLSNLEGAVDVGGILTVAGLLAAEGALNVSGNLSVEGAAEFTGFLTTVGGGLIGGDLTVAGILTQAGSSEVLGNFTVVGTTELTGVVDLGGDINIGGICNVIGDTNIGGFIDINGECNIAGALTVEGAVAINGGANILGLVFGVETPVTNFTSDIFIEGGIQTLPASPLGLTINCSALGIEPWLGLGGNFACNVGDLGYFHIGNVIGTVGVDIQGYGNIWCGADTNATSADGSKLNSALAVGGGVSIVKDVWIGGLINVAGKATVGGTLTVTGISSTSSSVNNLTTIVTSGGSSFLNAASNCNIVFTGTSSQTLRLSDATTIPLGYCYYITNNSTGIITINSSTGSFIDSLLSGQVVTILLISNGTSVGTWDISSSIPATDAWGSSGIITVSPISSTVAIGTAPMFITSTTNVANLNASSINGNTFAAPGIIGGTTANVGNFTVVNSTVVGTAAGFVYTNNGTGSSNMITGLAASLSGGNFGNVVIGQANTTNNASLFGFNYVSTGSNTNFASIGLVGSANTLKVLGTGQVLSNSYGVTGTSSGIVSILPQAASGTWNFNLPITSGAVGQVLTSQGGGSNAMVWTNSIGGGLTTVVSSGGTTTLTNSSNSNYLITGSTTQTFSMPDATTLTVGAEYTFNNNSSGVVTINTTLSSPICTIPNGGFQTLYLLNTSTANGSWDYHPSLPSGVSWGTVSMTCSNNISTTKSYFSTIATGSAPINVLSTTNCANLNASSINGNTFAVPGIIGGTTASVGNFTTINSTVTGTGPGFVYTNTGTGSANTMTAYAPSLTGGNFANAVIGQANSTNNAALFGFNYVSTGSSTNFASVGLVGSANSLEVLGTGQVTVPVNIASSSLTTGSFVTGGGIGCGGIVNMKSSGYVGSTSGIVSILPQAAAGTWNFNLPITAGSAGQVLTSQGGLGAAMTWGSAGSSGTVTSVGMTVPSFLSVSPSTITSTGTFAITATSTGTGNVVLSASPTLTGTVSGGIYNSSVTGTGPGFNYTNTGTGSANTITAYAPSITSGNFANMVIGQANSTNNAALFGYQFSGAGASNSFASVGLVGSADSLVVYGTGQVDIATNIASTTTTTGSLITPGGIGCGGQLTASTVQCNIYSQVSTSNNVISTTFTPTLSSGQYIAQQWGVNTSTNNGVILAYNYFGGSGSSTNNASFNINGQSHSLDINVPSATTSTTTGSVSVRNGGLGVEGGIICNGNISTNNNTNSFGYSEGTFTAVGTYANGSFNSYSFTTSGVTTGGFSCKYVKIGRMVTVSMNVGFSYGANSAYTVCINGLPYAPDQDMTQLASPQCNVTGLANDPSVYITTGYPTYIFICVVTGNGHPFAPQVGGASSQTFISTFTYYTTS